MKRVDDPVFALAAFYDLLSYPLTSVELWRLVRAWEKKGSAQHPCTLREITTRADAHPKLSCVDGFYTLTGREHLAEQRRVRYLETELNLRRAWKWLSALAVLPGIQAIFLCNTYGISNPSPASDIDLFILTTPGRIWTARLWSTTLMRLFRRRPQEGAEAGSICLSFYADPGVQFDAFAKGDADIYLDFWKQWLMPLYDPHRLRTELAKTNASLERPLTRRRMIRHRPLVKRILSLLPMESAARAMQWRLFPETIVVKANLSTDVVVTNHTLKFHTNDARETYAKQWLARLADAAHDVE